MTEKETWLVSIVFKVQAEDEEDALYLGQNVCDEGIYSNAAGTIFGAVKELLSSRDEKG